MGKSADAGKDNAISAADDFWISGHPDIGRSSSPQGIANRLKIARAIIDECNAHGYNVPLVDGMLSALRASISTACRSARAKAL